MGKIIPDRTIDDGGKTLCAGGEGGPGGPRWTTVCSASSPPPTQP